MLEDKAVGNAKASMVFLSLAVLIRAKIATPGVLIVELGAENVL